MENHSSKKMENKKTRAKDLVSIILIFLKMKKFKK